MKLYIFADYTPQMNHFEIAAESPLLAVRELVAKHGQQPYRLVNVTSVNLPGFA